MKVKPIPAEYVKRIKDWTRANPRNYALFVIGINTGLRASDLVRLRLSDFWNGRFKHYLIIKQHKTGRNVKIAINQPVVEAVSLWRGDNPNAPPHAHLFYTTKRGHGRNYEKPITPDHVGRLVRQWCWWVGLRDGSYGAHSLRKTRGRAIYEYAAKSLGVADAWLVAANVLGHKDPKVTKAYIDITDEAQERIELACAL